MNSSTHCARFLQACNFIDATDYIFRDFHVGVTFRRDVEDVLWAVEGKAVGSSAGSRCIAGVFKVTSDDKLTRGSLRHVQFPLTLFYGARCSFSFQKAACFFFLFCDLCMMYFTYTLGIKGSMMY